MKETREKCVGKVHAAVVACAMLGSAGAVAAAPADTVLPSEASPAAIVDREDAQSALLERGTDVPAPGSLVLLLAASVIGLGRRRGK